DHLRVVERAGPADDQGGCLFDDRVGGDHVLGDEVVADAEMLQGPLRLRPPKLVGRAGDRTEAVVFNSSGSHGWSFPFAVALIEAGNRDSPGVLKARGHFSFLNSMVPPPPCSVTISVSLIFVIVRVCFCSSPSTFTVMTILAPSTSYVPAWMNSFPSQRPMTFALSSLLRSRTVPSGKVPGEALTTFHLPTTSLGLSFSSSALIPTASTHTMTPAPIRRSTFIVSSFSETLPRTSLSLVR